MTKDQMQKQYAELYEYYKATCADLSAERKKREQLSAENFQLKAKLERAQRSLDILAYRISMEDAVDAKQVKS